VGKTGGGGGNGFAGDFRPGGCGIFPTARRPALPQARRRGDRACSLAFFGPLVRRAGDPSDRGGRTGVAATDADRFRRGQRAWLAQGFSTEQVGPGSRPRRLTTELAPGTRSILPRGTHFVRAANAPAVDPSLPAVFKNVDPGGWWAEGTGTVGSKFSGRPGARRDRTRIRGTRTAQALWRIGGGLAAKTLPRAVVVVTWKGRWFGRVSPPGAGLLGTPLPRRPSF